MEPGGSSARAASKRRRTIIIIAPAEMSGAVCRAVSSFAEVVAFETLDDLDEWRLRQGSPTGETIGVDLVSALGEVGCERDALPQQLQLVFAALAVKTAAPTVAQLQDHWASRRSFYRTWTAAIPVPPSAFLRRLRAIHAARLLGLGMAPKAAAHAAGFSSADRMRRVQRKPRVD